jgi:hypothetical protein
VAFHGSAEEGLHESGQDVRHNNGEAEEMGQMAVALWVRHAFQDDHGMDPFQVGAGDMSGMDHPYSVSEATYEATRVVMGATDHSMIYSFAMATTLFASSIGRLYRLCYLYEEDDPIHPDARHLLLFETWKVCLVQKCSS